jgi:cytochrome P450
MRLLIPQMPSPARSADPSAPDLAVLTQDSAAALRSFFATVERIVAANPVATGRLQELAAPQRGSASSDAEVVELQQLQRQALRQGRAVAAVIGFFLKLKPYPMLEEVRSRGALFQPAFGPVLVVDGDSVRNVLERDQEFTVDPYGAEMVKVMSPRYNGGFSTFILSTDDNARYEPDKRLLSAVCNRQDAERMTGVVHRDCMRRLGSAVQAARANGSPTIDVVTSVARYVPVTLGQEYLGVPVADRPGTFELTGEMLTYYGEPIDGQQETALGRHDGVIPDEAQMYSWITAAFRHFFNNVQKDAEVQKRGFRACRLLLAYLLREIAIQRQRILEGSPVADTMLTRLLHVQLGRSTAAVARPADLDPRLVSDLRIAENVMGTIVGAVAGQEEATGRVIDSLMRLKDGECRTDGLARHRYGRFAEARDLALNVLNDRNVAESRAGLHAYFLEALRLQPQGEVLVRRCGREGARIGDSRPIAAGTLVFVSHGSAMKDVPEPDAFMLDRPLEHYPHYGWGRHACLGQHVSAMVIVETMTALLGLEGLARPAARPGEPSFPFERRHGRLQLDEENLYATSFVLEFSDSGTTRQFWPAAAGNVEVM